MFNKTKATVEITSFACFHCARKSFYEWQHVAQICSIVLWQSQSRASVHLKANLMIYNQLCPMFLLTGLFKDRTQIQHF